MKIEDQLNRIIEKQDEMGSDISDIKVIQGRHDENLKEHMNRSLANEKTIEIVREYTEQSIKLLKDDLVPVKRHVDSFHAILKFLGFLSASVAFVVAVFKLVELLK